MKLHNVKTNNIADSMRSERGSALLMVLFALVALFAFAVLAIDGAVLMTTKTQLQSAADASALAGASGLIDGDQNTATSRCIDFASSNKAFQATMTPVVIDADDVSFPAADIVRVRTHRTAATGDALRTFFVKVIDSAHGGTSDMSAVASARAFDVCSSRCLKPWVVPDQFDDANENGVYDDGEYYDAETTGYVAPRDVGMTVVLKVGNPRQAVSPGVFYPVDFPPLNDPSGDPPLTGGAWYRTWISGCEPYAVGPGSQLQIEPGNMVGPTRQGMQELIDQDPGAYWDPVTKTVEGSSYATSPRVGLIPFFDPTLGPTSGRNYVTVSKIAAFFIESVGAGGEVNGRFIQMTTQGLPCVGGLGSSFVKGIALVE